MDPSNQAETFTAFAGTRRLAHGAWPEVATAARAAAEAGLTHIVVLSDASGETRDFEQSAHEEAIKSNRGRPRLGVTAREVTLLPRHWDWLAQQPGGASAALRRLVDAARKDLASEVARHELRTAIHRAMTTLAGDLPGYEDALRHLYSGDQTAFIMIASNWPEDVRAYILNASAKAT